MAHARYDLAVAYRIYPRISKSAPPCFEDKYTLAEVCLKSFKASLGSLRARIWVVLDGCPPEYRALFTRYFDGADLEFIPLQEAGNAATFERQRRILLEQDVSPLVYFAEDDYFYLPDRFHHLPAYFEAREDVHFVSPYDHGDYYTLALHDHPTTVAAFGGRHWRRSATTCLTFLTSKDILKRTEAVFRTYARRNYDTSIWLALTKYTLSKPTVLYRMLREDGAAWKTVAKTGYFGWRQLCFGRRWNLWTPLPGIATHLERGGFAPAVDWRRLLDEAVAEWRAERAGEQGT